MAVFETMGAVGILALVANGICPALRSAIRVLRGAMAELKETAEGARAADAAGAPLSLSIIARPT